MRFLTACLLILAACQGELWCESELDTRIRRGQDALYRLDYRGAEALFQEVIAERPDDPVGYAFLSILYWNELLQAAGNLALDDYATPTPFTKGKTHKPIAEETRKFREANDKLLNICDRILENEETNLSALYFKGVAYENLAAEALAIIKSSRLAISYGKKARGFHKKVVEKDPSFVDAKLTLGTYEFAVATLPLHWRILLALFLIRGNKEKALSMLEEVSEKGLYRRLDATVVLALLHSWKGDPQRAVQIFDELGREYPRNYLLDINKAAIYEVALKNSKAALSVYQNLLQSLPDKAPWIAPAEVHYRIGRTLYNMRDYSLALESFEDALESPRKERETPFLCSFYMGRIFEERGDSRRARESYRKMLEYDGPSKVLEKEIAECRERLKHLGQ